MMCFLVKRKLMDFVEQTLPPSETAGVEDHLKHCRSCRQELALIRKGLAVVSAHRMAENSDAFWKDFDDRLWKRIQDVHAPALRPGWNMFWKPVVAVLPVVAVTLAVLANLSVQKPQEQAQQEALVKETAWLVSEARDPQLLSSGEEDPADELEDLYELDPSMIRKIS